MTERVKVIIKFSKQLIWKSVMLSFFTNVMYNFRYEHCDTFSLRRLCYVFVTNGMLRFRCKCHDAFSLGTFCYVFAKCVHYVYSWQYIDFQKSPKSPNRRKSSDESIASSFVAHDPKKDRKFSKQRSFGFGRPSQAPSEVSVNLTPDRASNANLDDLAVSRALE